MGHESVSSIKPLSELGSLELAPPYRVVRAQSFCGVDRWMATVLLGPASADDVARWGSSAEPLGESEILVIPAAPELDHPGGLRGLIEVVRRLLEPEGGCPWDLEQTHESLGKFLIEESYELIEAVSRADFGAVKEELGDVLLQPLMHCRMAEKDGKFSLEEVAQQTADKLVHRHPHVFGESTAKNSAEVLKQWDAIKRDSKGVDQSQLLAEVPKSMPALLLALNVSKRAARVGFEWPDIAGVFAKLQEEVAELDEAIKSDDLKSIEAELGDLLFTVVNLARWAKVDPELALRGMVSRFIERFTLIEKYASRPLVDLSPEEWDALWNRAKREANLKVD